MEHRPICELYLWRASTVPYCVILTVCIGIYWPWLIHSNADLWCTKVIVYVLRNIFCSTSQADDGYLYQTSCCYRTINLFCVIFKSRTDLISLLILFLVFLLEQASFKKAYGSIVSDQIRIKFGTNVFHVNTHLLDFRFDSISRWRP